MSKLDTWAKHRKQTKKQKEKGTLLKQAREGSRLAVKKLKKDHGITFRRETC